MKQVNAKGNALTLKLLKRHPDATIEPPKAGRSLSKSLTVSMFFGHSARLSTNPRQPVTRDRPTDDSIILGAQSVKLLRALKLDPLELRVWALRSPSWTQRQKLPRGRRAENITIFGQKGVTCGVYRTPGANTNAISMARPISRYLALKIRRQLF